MSYSFTVRAATKAEATSMVALELDKVVAGQPIHAKDREQAQAAVEAFVGVISDPDDSKVVEIRVNGSVTWTGNPIDQQLLAASVSVSATLLNA